MQSQCMKTGAQVYLAQYDVYVVTDLMKLGPVWHFWVSSPSHIRAGKPVQGYDRINLTVHSVSLPLRNADHFEVLAHEDACGAFTYTGEPVA